MATTDLSWDDLRLLSTLVAEQADDSKKSLGERERLADMAERIFASEASGNDLRTAGKLAELDASLQRDAKVRDRYLALAKRALAAAR